VKPSADSVRLLRRADVLACLEPVEVIEGVRGATEAIARGDAPAALDALDPDVEWHATVGGIDEGRVYGREEVAAGMSSEP
jgi:hypothetical protein